MNDELSWDAWNVRIFFDSEASVMENQYVSTPNQDIWTVPLFQPPHQHTRTSQDMNLQNKFQLPCVWISHNVQKYGGKEQIYLQMTLNKWFIEGVTATNWRKFLSGAARLGIWRRGIARPWHGRGPGFNSLCLHSFSFIEFPLSI